MCKSKIVLAMCVALSSKAAVAQSTPPGYAAAARAYAAFEKQDYVAAVRHARAAANLAPASRDYQMLLFNSLVAARQRDEALSVAERIALRFGPDAGLQLQRVNLLLEAGRRSEARAVLSDVVRIAPSQSAEARNARIALADVALSEADHRGALDALSGVDEVSYERHSRLGFAYGGLGRHELASQSFGTAFHLAISANQRALMARSQIDSLAQLTRREEAKALLLRYLANGALAPAKPLEIAYLATATGADSTAHEYFSRAESEGSLVGSAFLDAAYTARRLDENDAALRYFRAAISADRAGTLSLEPQSRLNVTREVVNLERDFGGYISVVRSPTAAFAGATPGSRDATYVGGEFYWQPLAYDNSVELFVRGLETLAADEGATGSETLQGYVGARWRPVLGYDLLFEGSYLFPVGSAAREDWLVRTAYSLGRGGDLRLDKPAWDHWSVFGELGYFFRSDQTIANAEGRYGRAFRIGDVSTYAMITPFLGARFSYDTALPQAAALGFGPGINLRRGVGANPWRAPSSFLDVVMQYRFRIAGGEQAEGLTAGATLSF